MKKIIFALFTVVCLAQKPLVIKPDGVTKTTVTHRVDLSSCDLVKIEIKVDDLRVSGGVVHVYGWKKFGNIPTITCEMEH